ncbi:MAG: membrane protein insertase YidC [Bacteroidales bacterium]|nr:membrane protein insertase YidC [Bacteroidales bacterium]
MDKNTIIGLLLVFALCMGFSFFTSHRNAKQREAAEQAAAEQQANLASGAETAQIEEDYQTIENSENLSSDTTGNVRQAKKLPLYATAFRIPEDAANGDFQVSTNRAIYSFARKGGYLKRVELKNVYKFAPKDSVKPQVVLYEDDANSMNIDLMLKNQAVIHSKDLTFSSEVKDTLIVDKDSAVLSLKVYPAAGTDSVGNQDSYIEYRYTFFADDYHFDYKINFVNMSDYLYANNSGYSLEWDARLTCQERNYQIAHDMTTVYFMDNVQDVDNLDERKSDKKDFSSPLKWVSFKQQFFTSILVAKSGDFSTAAVSVTAPDKAEKSILKTMSAELDFRVSDLDNGSFDMMMYVGPNQYKILKGYDLKLERLVPLGWGFFLLHWINRGIILPIFDWLQSYGISYGIIILILSIFIKLVVTPLNYKTYISSAKMRALKPEIEVINKRYPHSENQDEMMKKQQATMALYKSAGASPMAGCLPALIQMPILIAMYRFFPSAYELRQQSFLWADDLSAYDSILDLSFNIPLYGNHVSLFTLLMTISTILYTYMNNKLMSPNVDNNDPQQKMMKWMMYLMPIMFLFMFNSFSSGLTYYYLLINLITFAQNGIFILAVNQDKLRAKLLENMKKPVQKTKWQARMEQMMKQQQQMAKQQGRK